MVVERVDVLQEECLFSSMVVFLCKYFLKMGDGLNECTSSKECRASVSVV